MSYYIESYIRTYSGLSSEDKPSIANGINPPNGSRWREVDTGKTYHYNIEDDTWYETDSHALAIAGHAPIVDLRALDVLEQMLITLKKIEWHLSEGSNTELKDKDV